MFRAKLRTLVCKPPVNCSVTHKPLDNKNNGTCYDCYQFVIKRLIEIAETRINTGFFKQLDLFKLYDKAKDELSNLEIELDTAPKYQLPEPEKFMTAKAYKTKMAEPVVRKLKQLVKTVLARCFEGWDNYHRLNTANAQLYRTNQRLEKVNERLTEENKILKAENKDYSLLRKVFGRKQIDDLLEQARTVKGRKRDNTRSR